MKILSRLSLLILLLAAISAVALTLCLFARYSTIEIDWGKTKDVFDVLKNFTEIVAIVGGATWAYFKFSKSRTFKENLGLKVSGKVIPVFGGNCLLITAEVKNIGSSLINIEEEGTAVSVWLYKPPLNLSEVLLVETEGLAAFSIGGPFQLEPNESREYPRLITLPVVGHQAVRIEFSVTAGEWTWEAATIVQPAELAETKEQ